MKKIITIFMATIMLLSVVGCSSTKVKRDEVLSQDLTKVLEKIYETSDLDSEFRNSLEYYQTVELDESNIEGYLGNTNVKFIQGLCSAPMMRATPYELILLKLDEKADVEAVKAEIKENANPRKWICVQAEDIIVESIDNTVIFLMANKSESKPIKEAFMNLAESK